MHEDEDYVIYGRNRGDDRATGWFVAIIIALALLAIGYLAYEANSEPRPGAAQVMLP